MKNIKKSPDRLFQLKFRIPDFQLHYLVIQFLVFVFFSFSIIPLALATGEAPSTIAISGELFDGPNSVAPLLDSNAMIRIQILNPNKKCILYDEVQTVSTTATNGAFTVNLGSAVGSTKRVSGSDPGNSIVTVYQNVNAIPATGSGCTGNSYTPAAGDVRYVRITVTPSATGVADTLTPDMTLGAVPMANVAERAENIQGYSSSQLLKVNTLGGVNLSQSNLESLFTSSGLTNLQNLAAGKFVSSSTASGASLPSFATNPSSPPAGSIWFDSTTNQVKYSDGSGTPQVLSTGGGGGSVSAATTSAAGIVTLASSGGTTAGTVVQATDSRLSDSRAPSGSAGGDLTGTYPNPSIATITTAGKVSGNAITSGTIGGSTAISTTGLINTSGNIQTSGVLRLYDAGPTNHVSLKAPSSVTTSYTLTWPAAVTGTSGYVLSSDTSGNLSWVAPATGTVTSVTGTAPISVGGTAAAPVVSVTAATTSAAGVVTLASSGGTTAGTVVQATDSRLSDSRAPSGSAGGDLSGTYPNPSIATITTAGKVSGNAITSGTIGGSTAISTTGLINTSGNIQTSGVLRLYDAGPTNHVSLKAPSSVTTSYTLTWPAAVTGTSGYVLSSDTSGNLSWVAPATGTVTSVTGTAPVSVGGTAAAPVVSVSAATTSASGVVTLASSGGTTAGTVVQATDSRLSDSRAPSGSAGGDLSGTYPSPSVAKIQGKAVSSTAPSADGQVLRYDGSTQYAPAFLGLADIRATITPFGGVFASAGCTASQTLYWQSSTDTFQCQSISISASNFGSQSQNSFLAGPATGGAGTAAFRSIASADLPTSGVTAGTYNSVTVDIYGRVTAGSNSGGGGGGLSGSGTTNKLALFSSASAVADSIVTQSGTNQVAISGQINSTGATNQTSSFPTINFNNGNTVYASSTCQAVTLQNMIDGGTYTLTIKGNSGTCTFSSSGDTVHYTNGASNVVINAHTVFSFLKMGTDVYVTWVSF